MKPDSPARHFLLALVMAVVVYVIFYQGIEHRRTRKGPWEAAFTTNSDGVPALIINQAKLAITNVQIVFMGEHVPSSNQLPSTLRFSQPRPVPFDLPFGKCIFSDLTFLPGTVTFSNFFGHEIELLPRVLIIDYHEHPWRSDSTITLPPKDKPAPSAP
jgi:hypothetical protein